MNPQKIVLTLGYLSLILIAVYFVTGLLKIGGEGLSKLGYTETFIEGMTNEERQEKQLERLSKKLDKDAKTLEEQNKQAEEDNDYINDVMGLSEFSQVIEILKTRKENDIKKKIVDEVTNGRGLERISASIIKDSQLIQALDSYASGTSKATGGYL